MNKEEAKQYIRNQIDSSFKIQTKYDKKIYYLYYNKQYLRALKLSKITNKIVSKKNFKEGEKIIFEFNTETKRFLGSAKISKYLTENYSNDFYERTKLMKEVLNDHEEYNGYKWQY